MRFYGCYEIDRPSAFVVFVTFCWKFVLRFFAAIDLFRREDVAAPRGRARSGCAKEFVPIREIRVEGLFFDQSLLTSAATKMILSVFVRG